MPKELQKNFDPNQSEERIYKAWEDNGCFKPSGDKTKQPYTIVIPPPNVTGQLHMGHALDDTLQDILIRYKRMKGFDTLWVPGTDHAGIATQIKVEENLRKEEGLSRYDLGREQKIAELETQVALRDASIYTDGKLNDFRNYVDRRFGEVHAQLNQQAVYNATNTAALTCMQGQIAQLYSLTKLVVPNGSICPGWGEVTTTITPATAG